MTTLVPRAPYTDAELKALFPKDLRLEQVQVILRHGERSPVSERFQNAGLPERWPYCSAAMRLTSAVMTADGWDTLAYRRRIETLGVNDLATIAKGPNNELNGICQPGELTDEGRVSTLELGQRLRHLYIKQLKFLPDTLSNPDTLYLRSTPIPRALESIQQAFTGLYPVSKRDKTAPFPVIITRAPADETLYPNTSNCKRFAQLSAAFADRAAQRWNDSPDMEYLTKKLGKWMPKDSPRVKVDSHPRLSGIMDTLNSTLAHGPATRLPSEFYEPKVREIIDRIGTEEWFAGYMESREYRTLGIGGLVGDVVTRMVGHVENSCEDGSGEVGGVGKESDARIRFALSGAHDTTLAGFLASMGAFKGESWPPYTSHIAIELFRGTNTAPSPSANTPPPSSSSTTTTWWTRLFNLPLLSPSPSSTTNDPIGRIPTPDLTPLQREKLNGYYVRVRYNDRVMRIPGCKPAGKHWHPDEHSDGEGQSGTAADGKTPGNGGKGDETLCTLRAFKEIADKFTPQDWKGECMRNLEGGRNGKKVPVLEEEGRGGVEEAGF